MIARAYRKGERRFWYSLIWYWIHHPRSVHGPALFCGDCWGIWWKVQNGEYPLIAHHASRVPGLKRQIPKLSRLG